MAANPTPGFAAFLFACTICAEGLEMKNVNDWRNDIDRIDSEILRLLSRRAQIAIEVGCLKRAHGAPLYSPERENQVLARVIEENSGPLAVHSIQQIFRLIVRETRRAEQNAAHSNGASLSTQPASTHDSEGDSQ